jgi:uncharacterized protein (TIGR03437 family)
VAVRIVGQGWTSNVRELPVLRSNPAIFTSGATGYGQAAALNADHSVNSLENPAARGSVIVLYATGVSEAPVAVRVAGRPARLLFAGQAPGMVQGVQQINAEVPADCPAGAVPVTVRSGETTSVANVTIAVR